jgi:hypothetical protein
MKPAAAKKCCDSREIVAVSNRGRLGRTCVMHRRRLPVAGKKGAPPGVIGPHRCPVVGQKKINRGGLGHDPVP